MDQALLIWLFGITGAGLLGILKLWWDHIRECRARIAEAAVMRADINRLMHEVGDHETGLRGAMHALRNEISPFVIWAERKMEKE